MKKSSLLTFLFALIPGAGQMYQGYMKRGISLIATFALVIFITTMIPIGAVFLPILWAYSFFDTFHIRNGINETYVNLKDEYLFGIGTSNSDILKGFFARRHLLVGWGLVVFGIYMIFENFVKPPLRELYYATQIYWPIQLINSVPTLVVSAVLVVLGFYLIRGKKAKENQPNEFIEYKGNSETGDDK